jgi:hypothetical protein
MYGICTIQGDGELEREEKKVAPVYAMEAYIWGVDSFLILACDVGERSSSCPPKSNPGTQ